MAAESQDPTEDSSPQGDNPKPQTTTNIGREDFDNQITSLARRRPRMKMAAVAMVIGLAVVNVAVICLAIWTLISTTEKGEECLTQRTEREVVAPLCVPCQEGWVKEEGEKEKEEEEGTRGGWRRYKDEGRGEDVCCPLQYHSLASAVRQIYRTVLTEKQQDLSMMSPSTFVSSVFGLPESTGETVEFANIYKPSAHITGVQPYNASQYFTPEGGTSGTDDSLQTISDWPLRFERYRSSTSGYVQPLTWGLVVPVSGLYRIHSTINFYFAYSQHTKQTLQQEGPVNVIHQVTRYQRAEGVSTVLTQRNQTVSGGYTDGLTSFLVTAQRLEVGDVISIRLSHRSAMAVRDRWHSQGLFLLQ